MNTMTAASSSFTANDVVLNDKATIVVGKNDKVLVAPFVTPTPAAARARVLELVAERKAWEVGTYIASNNERNAILGKIYGFYFDLRGNDKDSKAARAELDDLMCKTGYSFKQDTHMLNKLVKFVFGSVDRRRVSTYALVLRAALADEIKVDGIPAFIADGGGVEQIRRRKSGTAMSPKQKAELGKQTVSANNLAVISSPALLALAGDASEGDDLVAVVTMQADGSFVVRALVNNKSVVNAALVCAYSKSKSVVENDKRNAKAANDEKSVDELVDAALAA
jgi:hypothetical protein